MKEKLKIVFMIAPLVLIIDQITKWLVVKNIVLGERIPVLGSFFDIVHIRNEGAAFGILSEWNSSYRELFFYVLSFAALIFLFSFLKQLPPEEKKAAYPIGLIFGGALGNVMDRITRGSVVDFLSFHWASARASLSLWSHPVQFDLAWPAFNVADSAITVGVIWLLILMGSAQRIQQKI